MPLPTNIGHTILVGIGATAFMDAWLLLQRRMGLPSASFALVGRWVAGMPQGQFVHVAIAQAPPQRFELALGWLIHYAVGIAYTALLVAAQGDPWLQQPTYGPALACGLVTVLVPLFVMQPAMGAGFAATKTSAPLKNALRSLANHAVFGSGLYVAAAFIAAVTR